ncbi:hypothetical protein HJG60_000157 [Phyllostomus discolor]|uniref:Uncharacterized protein n=1 Tax=Phyllostomus discolor TaxID=89673 RepID=A0A834ED69_9CHIR|nr:hypothetical protein HJG60_000157 [Phyllostomus discolor]
MTLWQFLDRESEPGRQSQGDNAFWDRLKEQLSATPPDYTCALEPLKEIEEIVLSLLLARQNRLRSEIKEALNRDLLKQEAEHRAQNFCHLSKYTLSTIALLCVSS